MRKDIEIPIAKNIQIVAVKEWDKDFLAQTWNVYLVNDREDTIEAVLVMSRGNSDDLKTATLRHGLGDIASKTAAKVEYIAEDVLGFTNEYMVTFFAEGQLFERNFIFEPHSISEEKTETLPMLDMEGIIAK